MTTQRDLDTASQTSLKICEKCGWYDGYSHSEKCDPAAGQIAKQLIASVPGVSSGQLGYGDRCVAFNLSDDFSVVFEYEQHVFSLRYVHLLERLSIDESATLIRTLKNWLNDTMALASSIENSFMGNRLMLLKRSCSSKSLHNAHNLKHDTVTTVLESACLSSMQHETKPIISSDYSKL